MTKRVQETIIPLINTALAHHAATQTMRDIRRDLLQYSKAIALARASLESIHTETEAALHSAKKDRAATKRAVLKIEQRADDIADAMMFLEEVDASIDQARGALHAAARK